MKTELVSLSKEGDIDIAKIELKRLDQSRQMDEIYRTILDLVESKEKIKLIIDFEEVEFLSSGFLSKLISIRNFIKSEGGVLAIAGLREEQKEIFDIANLTALFKMYRLVEDALEKLKKIT